MSTFKTNLLVAVLFSALLPFSLNLETQAQSKNGFNLQGALIPANEVMQGGPPRDGIPALTNPEFTSAQQADSWMNGDDRVLAIERNGIAKAYPIRILNWHELVNDEFNGEPILISYCPLCGTGMSFKAEIDGSVKTFGVSGLLYNSDVLMYDRQTESLWSQLMMKAVSGPLRGEELEPIAQKHTTWRAWKEEHPNTLVLSKNTGHNRNYSRNPYQGYERTRATYFPTSSNDNSYHPKEWVVGIKTERGIKAYPFEELEKASNPLRDTIGGKQVLVHYDKRNNTARITDTNGEELPSVMAYWFAWTAFYPDSDIFKN